MDGWQELYHRTNEELERVRADYYKEMGKVLKLDSMITTYLNPELADIDQEYWKRQFAKILKEVQDA
jgi:hypothetical protein